MRFAEVVERLATLPEDLPPGPEALVPVLASTGAARLRPRWDEAGVRRAAVLVLVYPDEDGEARVLLTERTDGDGAHAGEVSFPGGAEEPGDADLVATALREAAEEVGLDAAAAGVRIVGTFPPLTIPVSSFEVTPVVAVADRRPELAPSPAEVARILEAPVRAFLPTGELMWVEREIRGFGLRYAAYPVEGVAVWGMTARVLGGLGALLAGRQPA